MGKVPISLDADVKKLNIWEFPGINLFILWKRSLMFPQLQNFGDEKFRLCPASDVGSLFALTAHGCNRVASIRGAVEVVHFGEQWPPTM